MFLVFGQHASEIAEGWGDKIVRIPGKLCKAGQQSFKNDFVSQYLRTGIGFVGGSMVVSDGE